MSKKVVIVAMSGGVDSSVAAALLCREGYEVVGVTMCFSLPDGAEGRPACCGPEAIADARRVADALGIRHHVFDFSAELRRDVIDDFVREYRLGRTPNPCVRCNERLKFDTLLKKTLAAGAEFLATGHYARILGGDEPRLARAVDPSKDQTYFLYRLRGETMRSLLFPLGGYAKADVRRLAREFHLEVAEKQESQEICFVPDREALNRLRAGGAPENRPGPIVDAGGSVIGTHDGVALYTVGQRRGMGVAAAHPLYVLRIDPESNTITAGPREEAFRRVCAVGDLVFPGEPVEGAARYHVRIRHNHREAAAELTVSGGEARVVFDEPQFAITPGQSAVFYDGDVVAGGGVIDRIIE